MRLSLPFALPDRRRTVSFVLALVVEALLILVLVLFGPHFTPPTKPEPRRATSFSLSPSPDKEAATSPQHRTKANAATRPVSGQTTPVPPLPPIVTPPKVPTPPAALPGVLPIQLGASDISKLKSSAPSNDDGTETGPDSKLAYGPGIGPGGESYYHGEWYRLPTPAEVDPYLPKRPPDKGWAQILCKTAPRYHVEDCRVLSEGPAGAGMGRAALNMSWQYLIRPPRRNGKELIGAPIGVLFTYTTTHRDRKAQTITSGDDQADDPN